MITVYIPTSLREFTNGRAMLQLTSETIAQLFETLEAQFPGIGARLYDQHGQVWPYIAVFVNGQSIGHLQQKETSLRERDEVHIIPAMAGG
ncbi:hypothetical protein KSF_046960 [Reticulibacter mediterranei]|uniref:Molybdopterin synthase sulfur carrier subunit n=1 Tax=Reticulibacter mediterranei TaxID=2778369 RepID=A0A8J3ILL9_9CHLR|nr:MoaD/ThiS family protein [Reticulibacter mediterranei]GHO94648.1 hypothetical protein KSF_046960 [Reticulibacter mediterranei]